MPEDFLSQFLRTPPKLAPGAKPLPAGKKNRKLGENIGDDLMDMILGGVGINDPLDPDESSATVLAGGATAGLLPWRKMGKGTMDLARKAKGWIAPASTLPELKLGTQVDPERIFNIMKGPERLKVSTPDAPAVTKPVAVAPKPAPVAPKPAAAPRPTAATPAAAPKPTRPQTTWDGLIKTEQANRPGVIPGYASDVHIQGNVDNLYDQRVLGSDNPKIGIAPSPFAAEVNLFDNLDKQRRKGMDQALRETQLPFRRDFFNIYGTDGLQYARQPSLPTDIPIISHAPEVSPRVAESAGKKLDEILRRSTDTPSDLVTSLHVTDKSGGSFANDSRKIQLGTKEPEKITNTLAHEARHAYDQANNPDIFKGYPSLMFAGLSGPPPKYFNHPSETIARAAGNMEEFTDASKKVGQGILDPEALLELEHGKERLNGDALHDLVELQNRQKPQYPLANLLQSQPRQDTLGLSGTADAIQPGTPVKPLPEKPGMSIYDGIKDAKPIDDPDVMARFKLNNDAQFAKREGDYAYNRVIQNDDHTPGNFPPFSGVRDIPKFTPEQEKEIASLMAGLIDPVTEPNIKKAWEVAAKRYPRQMSNIRDLRIVDFDPTTNGTQMTMQNRAGIDAIDAGEGLFPTPDARTTSAVSLTKNRNERGMPRFSGDVLESLTHELKHVDDQARIPDFERKYMDQQRDVGYHDNAYEVRARNAATSATSNPRTRQGLIGGPPPPDAVRIPITENGNLMPSGTRFDLKRPEIPAYRSKAGMAIDGIEGLKKDGRALDFAVESEQIPQVVNHEGTEYGISNAPEYIGNLKSKDDDFNRSNIGDILASLTREKEGSNVDDVIQELANYHARPEFDPFPKVGLKQPPPTDYIDEMAMADRVNLAHRPERKAGETLDSWMERSRQAARGDQYTGGLADDQDIGWMERAMGGKWGDSELEAFSNSLNKIGTMNHPKFDGFLNTQGISGKDMLMDLPREDRMKIMAQFQQWLDKGGK